MFHGIIGSIMEHDNNIPYYYSNIGEVNQSLYLLSQHLVDQYGVSTTDFLIDGNGNRIDVVMDLIVWDNQDIFTSYKLGRFSHKFSLQYGNHYMLTVVERFGDEQEIRVHVFSTRILDNGLTDYVRSCKIVQLTRENQIKKDAWWDANKVDSNNGVQIAIHPDSTDDIAYEGELILYVLEQAEGFIKS